MKRNKTMSVAEQQILLKGAACQMKIAASLLRYAQNVMTPEEVEQIDFDFENGVAKGFELAERAMQMAEELKTTE